MNSLTYALMMSCKFDNTVIDNFKIDCFTRYISHKQLDSLGQKYNIAFKVVKYVKSKDKKKKKEEEDDIDASCM